MKRLGLIAMLISAGFAQDVQNTRRLGQPPDAAPDSRLHRDALIKDDYKHNLEDATLLAKLADELKSELENGDKNVVSVKAMKKADDIEKLAKNIHARLKRY